MIDVGDAVPDAGEAAGDFLVLLPLEIPVDAGD